MNQPMSVPETLLGLVERYSPSGQESAAVAYLVSRMKALGFSAITDQVGNAVGVRGEGEKQIVLIGHIDTVPGEIPMRLEGDDFYGRGSVDAKGPLAVFVDAAAAVAIPEDWQVVVIGAVDEERNSIGAAFAIPNYHPDAAIIGEPSRWDRITLGYKGSAYAEVIVTSSKAHTASAGKSACEVAVGIWNHLQQWAGEFNANPSSVFDQVQVSLRKMDTLEGDFEDWVKMRISARLPLNLSPEAYYTALQQIAEGYEVVALGRAIPAYRTDKQNKVARAFLGGIRAAGGEPGFLLKTGTADMNLAGMQWDCPMVAYGPGDSSLDHTPDEHLSIQEYHRSVETLKNALHRLMR